MPSYFHTTNQFLVVGPHGRVMRCREGAPGKRVYRSGRVLRSSVTSVPDPEALVHPVALALRGRDILPIGRVLDTTGPARMPEDRTLIYLAFALGENDNLGPWFSREMVFFGGRHWFGYSSSVTRKSAQNPRDGPRHD